MNTYHLGTNAFARKRLNLQGELYNPGSQQFLLTQGIKKGHTVLEIGCGSGSMTTWLAEQVGARGKVIAIDSSPAQIAATQRVVSKSNLSQVKCQVLSVFDLDQIHEQFDFVYARCLLMHVNEPYLALQKMATCLKKAGRIVVEEILNSCNFCYPASEFFIQRRKTIEQFYEKNKLNPNLGVTAKTLLKKLKLTHIEEFLFQPLLVTPKQRQLLTLIFHEIKDKLISQEILTIEQWQQLVDQLEKMQKDSSYFIALSSLYQISAQKTLASFEFFTISDEVQARVIFYFLEGAKITCRFSKINQLRFTVANDQQTLIWCQLTLLFFQRST